MSNFVCFAGPGFSIVGKELFINESPVFILNFNNSEDQNSILKYEWYLNNELVIGEFEANITLGVPYGPHEIAARILTTEGWSGVVAHVFFYNPIPELFIEGPSKLLEGDTVIFDVIATLFNGNKRNITHLFTLETTEGVFINNALTISENENHSDQRTITISAISDIGSINKQIIVLDSTAVTLVNTQIVGESFISEGETKQYQVIQYFSDGSFKNVSLEYKFKSTQGEFNGELLTMPTNQEYDDTRQVIITAQKDKTLLQLLIQVIDNTPILLNKIEIQGSSIIGEGESESYQVFEIFSDGSMQDKTDDYTFQAIEGIFNGNVLSIPSNSFFNDTRQTLITATHQVNPDTVQKNITIIDTTPVSSITYEISGPSIVEEGSYVYFLVYGIYPDGSKINLTSKYIFTTSEGEFSGGRLKIEKNTVVDDDRQIVITAKRTGFSNITKLIQIQDTSTDTLLLVSLTITGPTEVVEGSQENLYFLTANYENNVSIDRTLQSTFELEAVEEGIFDGNNLTVFSNSNHNDSINSKVTGFYGGLSVDYPILIVDNSPITLVSLTLSGPTLVDEGSTDNIYTVLANYSDGTSIDKTSEANFSFSISSRASFNANELIVFSNNVTGDSIQGNVMALLGDVSAIYQIEIIDKTQIPLAFEFTIKTDNISSGSSGNNQFKLPLVFNGTYDFVVNWGDGSSDNITTFSQSAVTHSYASAGVYTITCTGLLIGLAFNNNGDRLKLLEILKWGGLRLNNQIGVFAGCENLTLSNVSGILDLTGVTSLQNFFYQCSSITIIQNIEDWDVSNITNTSFMFFNATSFNQSLNNWDVSSVINMTFMFSQATSFNQPLNNWNTIKVINMSFMFSGALSFNQPIGSWNLTGTTNISGMFGGISIFNQDLSAWDTSDVTNMSSLFYGCSGFNQPLNSWDTGNVTNMVGLFAGTSFNYPLSNWDTSKVTDMSALFYRTPFNQDISGWDVSNVTNMNEMFLDNRSFNQNIGNWNVGKVVNMGYMFYGARAFNQDISRWNVGVVNNMSDMFNDTPAFTADISDWNVSNVANFSNFMLGKTSSTMGISYLDNIYNKWSLLNLKSGVSVHFGVMKYSNVSAAARQSIINNYNWAITDGGLL